MISQEEKEILLAQAEIWEEMAPDLIKRGLPRQSAAVLKTCAKDLRETLKAIDSNSTPPILLDSGQDKAEEKMTSLVGSVSLLSEELEYTPGLGLVH
jgi:hypothetical protein